MRVWANGLIAVRRTLYCLTMTVREVMDGNNRIGYQFECGHKRL